MPQDLDWHNGPKRSEPAHDPQFPPMKDPPDEPMHDPAGDPTYEPERPFGDPTPTPGKDPRPQNPEVGYAEGYKGFGKRAAERVSSQDTHADHSICRRIACAPA